MASEKFENSAASTLNGAINNSVTSLVVTSAASFPSAAQFRILIESEIMLVTAVSGTTFTVSRGQEGTTAASHADTTAVTHIFTKGAFNQIISDNMQRVAFSSLPSAEKAGRIVRFSDSNYLTYDTGSVWKYHGPQYNFTPPDNSQFSWANQGSATVSTSNGHILLNTPWASGDNFRVRYKSAPSTPYTVSCYVRVSCQFVDYAGGGICFFESASNKIVFFAIGFANSNRVGHGTTTGWSTDKNFNMGTGPEAWIRLKDDGTNIKFFVSPDGFQWNEVHTVGRTTNFTTAPTHVGHFVHNESAGAQQDCSLALYSWLEA